MVRLEKEFWIAPVPALLMSKTYRCGYCGEVKKNHSCNSKAITQRDMSTQVDLLITGNKRLLLDLVKPSYVGFLSPSNPVSSLNSSSQYYNQNRSLDNIAISISTSIDKNSFCQSSVRKLSPRIENIADSSKSKKSMYPPNVNQFSDTFSTNEIKYAKFGSQSFSCPDDDSPSSVCSIIDGLCVFFPPTTISSQAIISSIPHDDANKVRKKRREHCDQSIESISSTSCVPKNEYISKIDDNNIKNIK